MAGDVTVTVVSGVIASADTGTADFTEADFGTPKACIVLLSDDPNDGTTVADDSELSIGFSDFSNDYCIAHQDEDGSAKVDCDAIKSNTSCYIGFDQNANIVAQGTAGVITDGVRLTNTLGLGNPFATVIMFGGADLVVALTAEGINSSVNGTATRAHSGFTDGDDKLVFFIGTDVSAEDSANSGINNSFGVCHVSGSDAATYTFVQRALGWASDHNTSIGTPSSTLSNEHVIDIITEPGGGDWGLEVTAWSSSSNNFTVTTRDVSAGSGMEVYSLALDLDDRKAKVGTVDSPITGSTWSITGMGFKPQFVGLLLTDNFLENVILLDASGGILGISSVAGSGAETCHSWYNEDAAPDTVTNNLFRSRAVDLREDDVSGVIQDHSFSSFDSGGITYTITTSDTSVKKWGFFAIEEPSGAPAVTQPIMRRWGGVPGMGRGAGRIGRSW